MIYSLKRQWMAVPALLGVVVCFYLTITFLQHRHSTETVMVVSLAGTAYAVSLLCGWVSFGRWFAMVIGVLGMIMMWLPIAAIPFGWFGGYLLWFGIVLSLIHQLEKYYLNEKLTEQVLTEKSLEEQNRLNQQLARYQVNLEALQEKHAAHTSLKSVAEEFASTLSLTQLADLIAKKTLQVIPKGELALVYFLDLDANELSLLASYGSRAEMKAQSKRGDLFDHWVFKHRQPLLVSDIRSDFRFDTRDKEFDPIVNSLLAAPLINEGRIMGVIRISSSQSSCFNTDDLRALSIIAVLASSALTNAVLYQKTEELAISDSLTGLYVHRYFRERFIEEHQRALISNTPFSVLMCDIDFFKQCNDQYGHAAGDLLLRAVASVLREGIGDAGIVARYGGEEFAAVLRNMDKEQAGALAEQLRRQVEAIRIPIRGMDLKTTISIGVASFPVDALDTEELIRLSDQALYRAKHQGRNVVCING